MFCLPPVKNGGEQVKNNAHTVFEMVYFAKFYQF